MNNFKIVLLFIVTLLCCDAAAQKLSTGFGIGTQLSKASYTDTFKNKLPTTYRPGLRVYALGRINLEGNIFFSPEVSYTMKGFKIDKPNVGVAQQEITVHYIEFKLLQEYTFMQKYFAKIGPSIGGAIYGRDKQISTANLKSSKPLNFDFAAWSRFEASIDISVGAHFGSGWIAELRYSKGTSNIYDGDDGPRVKNQGIGISIAKYLHN